MTATIRNYSSVFVESDGSKRGFGSMSSPVGEASIGGDHIIACEPMSIDPSDYIVLWEQSHRKLKFQQLGFRIVGEGSLIVWSRFDLPTSASDYTAAGTRKRWFNKAWPCKMAPWWFCDQTGLSYSTLSDEVADDGDLPKLMTTLIDSAATSVCDKVVLYNPGTSIVKIEKFLAQ